MRDRGGPGAPCRIVAKDIAGSNNVIGLMMVIPAGLTHYVVGGVDWRLLAFLLLGSLAGAVLGSRVTVIVPERPLRLVIVARSWRRRSRRSSRRWERVRNGL